MAYDDPSGVVAEPMVNQGLRGAAFCWAFTAAHNANWEPLTALSHMLDCSLFGLNPAAHHRMNLAWHLLNTALVFFLWRRLSGTWWPSAVMAALFGWHPMHVESVAWISQRKDLLSTVFWLLALLAYTRWTARPSRGGYALVAIWTALGLMAKPIVVTLPFTLLLLDYWPLRRWPKHRWATLIWEKVPLFAMSLATCVITVLIESKMGALDIGAENTLGMRLANALVSYARYIGMLFWPAALSPFYPHPGWWPWPEIIGSLALLLFVSGLVWRERGRRPWLLFGWCWFLGTLVPTIGIVQTGEHAMADRYTYISMLGLFTMLVWTGVDLASRQPGLRAPLSIATAALLTACFVRTQMQVPVWRDGIALFIHARSVVGEHRIVLRNLGTAAAMAGRPEEEVLSHYRRGQQLHPDYPFFQTELALAAARSGNFEQARLILEDLRKANPEDPSVHHNLGHLHLTMGWLKAAELNFRKVIELRPKMALGHHFLGRTLEQQGQLEESTVELREAIRLDRWNWIAQFELGVTCYKLQRRAEALHAFETALWINPGNKTVAENLDFVRNN